PYLSTREGRDAFTFQYDLFDGVFGDDVTDGVAPFNSYHCKIFIKLEFLKPVLRFQLHVDHFALAVRVGRKIQYFGAFRSFCKIVLPVAGNAYHGKTLDEAYAALPVFIYHIVNGALVVLFKYSDVYNVLAYKNLLLH